MKRTTDPHWREYPHVVEFRRGPNARHAVVLANGPVHAAEWALFSLCEPGTIDHAGRITDRGRRRLVETMLQQCGGASRTTRRHCIVWGPHDCTHLVDGSTIDGRTPPTGEPMESESYLDVRPDLVDCRYVALPDGAATSHICVVRLSRRRVELASGAPIVLGLWDEPVPPGRLDPMGAHADADGVVTIPAEFRGSAVTGVEGSRILGPIQPDGEASYVVEPWPGQVFEACRRLAGLPIPQDTLDAVWRAVDPIAWDVIPSGIRLAA